MTTPTRIALQKEARRVEEDALFSAKGHFESGRIWSAVNLWVGMPAAMLAAISGVSAFGDATTVAGVLAMLVAALVAVTTSLDPSKRSNSHQVAGVRFNSLRNRARSFREIDLESTTSDEELADSLKELRRTRRFE